MRIPTVTPPLKAHAHPTGPLHHYDGAGRRTQACHDNGLACTHTPLLQVWSPPPTSAGQAFPGASPYLKQCTLSCAPPTDVWSLRVPCSGCLHTHTATVVAHANVSIRPLHNSGAGHTASLGIDKSSAQDAVAPQRRGGSHAVYRNSGLAALLGAGVGRSHKGGVAPPRPR